MPGEARKTMFQRGDDMLARAAKEHLAQEITYLRGGQSWAWTATPGRTVAKVVNGGGGRGQVSVRDGYPVTVFYSDFIIPFAGFPPGMAKIGDRIAFGGATYEVVAPYGEPCCRFTDVFSTELRIHTLEVER